MTERDVLGLKCREFWQLLIQMACNSSKRAGTGTFLGERALGLQIAPALVRIGQAHFTSPRTGCAKQKNIESVREEIFADSLFSL
jgi:hypothetical protein